MIECAVINAGPLVALSLLDQLDLLPALFSQCWVPQTVFDEVPGWIAQHDVCEFGEAGGFGG